MGSDPGCELPVWALWNVKCEGSPCDHTGRKPKHKCVSFIIFNPKKISEDSIFWLISPQKNG